MFFISAQQVVLDMSSRNLFVIKKKYHLYFLQRIQCLLSSMTAKSKKIIQQNFPEFLIECIINYYLNYINEYTTSLCVFKQFLRLSYTYVLFLYFYLNLTYNSRLFK